MWGQAKRSVSVCVSRTRLYKLWENYHAASKIRRCFWKSTSRDKCIHKIAQVLYMRICSFPLYVSNILKKGNLWTASWIYKNKSELANKSARPISARRLPSAVVCWRPISLPRRRGSHDRRRWFRTKARTGWCGCARRLQGEARAHHPHQRSPPLVGAFLILFSKF